MRDWVLIALFLARPAWGDEGPIPPAGHSHIPLEAGQPAPARGVFADDAMARYDLARVLYLEGLARECHDRVAEPIPTSAMLITGGVGLVIGVAAGVLLHARWAN